MRYVTVGLFLLASTLSASLAFAADASTPPAATEKPKTAQQQRMTDCNKKAEGKTGDARKSFMSACLSGKEEAAPAPTNAKTAQQQKMTDCNKKAEGMKGDERKAFMSTCLKK